jgi:tetratricopeptide (TPR) repeat protein
MIRSADEVLELANADPGRALELGGMLLADGSGAGGREGVTLLRAMSEASARLGRFQDSIQMSERARELARETGDGEQELLATLTMSKPMLILGRSTEALKLIDGAAHLATTPYLESRVSFQRGAVWAMMGQRLRAIEAFEAALPAFKAAGDQEMIRSTLHGLGHQRLATGDLPRAQRDLERALEIAERRNEEPTVSGLKHNLGLLASYRGDIPEALALLLDSDEIYMRLTGSAAPQHVARSEVLLSVGRFDEAYQLAMRIADHHRDSGDPEHLANALLVAARAALLAGDPENALITAEEAATTFEEHERPLDAVDARRIALEAKHAGQGASDDLLRRAKDVAVALEADHQMVAAAQARLLASRIAIDLGELESAVRSLDAMSKVESGPVELRIHGQIARARLRLLRGDSRGADAAARSGLRLIDSYQAVLGATDLRMGLEQHGAELGSLGLDLAVDSGASRRILRWMDRTRARALRHRPVVADEDEEIQEALGRLRQVEAELRTPENRGDRSLERERRQLQERIRDADRLKRAGIDSRRSFDLEVLIETLEDRTLLEMAVHRGRLIGVLLSRGRARRLDLGPSEPGIRELAHLRFGMRRAARRGRTIEPRSVEMLDRMLLGEASLKGDDVILVPPPQLMAAPWTVLPKLRDKVVTISPSAEMWWQAEMSTEEGDGVVVVGGPDLAAAEVEIGGIGRIYEDARIFPPGSTVDVVKDAITGASVAHIASHATFQSENPMFSSLRLGDGDLNVYDIERLSAPPSIVVLSACDSGYTEAREGVELAGLTSALLSMGTRSVVASVGLVPDSAATSDLMVRFHRHLLNGMAPAAALSAAQTESLDDPAAFVAAASFICVGA